MGCCCAKEEPDKPEKKPEDGHEAPRENPREKEAAEEKPEEEEELEEKNLIGKVEDEPEPCGDVGSVDTEPVDDGGEEITDSEKLSPRSPGSPGTETETASLRGRSSSPGYQSPARKVNPLIESLQQKKRLATVLDANVKKDGDHDGIRFYTSTAICGGLGRRAYTITSTDIPTGGKTKGLRVDASSPFWHATQLSFSPASSYRVFNDIGNPSTTAYYPRPDDQFLMIVKDKVITVKHKLLTADVFVSPCVDQAQIMDAVVEALHLPQNYWGLRDPRGVLLERPTYSDLSHDTSYHVEGLEKSVTIQGDLRVTDWPRAAPIASRRYTVKIPFSASVEDVLRESAKLLLPEGMPSEGLGLTGEDGEAVEGGITGGSVLYLTMQTKTVVLKYEGRQQRLEVLPGESSVDVLRRVKLVLQTDMDCVENIKHTVKGVVAPCWRLIKGGEVYDLEEAELVRVWSDDRDKKRSEMVRRGELFGDCCKVFGVGEGGGARLCVRKQDWADHDEVEVLYDEGTETDGFYPATILSYHEEGYTVRFSNTEICPGVPPSSLYQPYAEKIPTTSKVVLFTPSRSVTISCLGKDTPIEVPPGMNRATLLREICKIFRLKKIVKMQGGSLGVYLRCRKTGGTLTDVVSMWTAMSQKSIYDLLFVVKEVTVTVMAETERVIETVLRKEQTEEEVMAGLKEMGRCGLGPAWVVYRESDKEKKPVCLTWDTVTDGGRYVMRETSKAITVQLDPRITHRSKPVRQEMVVPPHIRSLELWKVITVNPVLSAAEAWAALNLPEKEWATPSQNPVATAHHGVLGIVAGSDIDGPCLDLQALSFTAVRNMGYYCLRFPDKIIKVVDGDKVYEVFVAPGDSHRAVCDRVRRSVGCSEGWVVMGVDGATVVACDEGMGKMTKPWMAYDYIEAGGTYEIYREITITVTGRPGMEPLDVLIPPATSFDIYAHIRETWSVPSTTSLSLRNAVTSIPVTRPVYTHLHDGVTYECLFAGDETKE